MAENSKIEWTHHTFNPWWGCVKVSPACKNCYAESWAKRVGENVWGAKSSRRFFTDKHWDEPLKWNKKAAEDKERRRVFCASMADIFEYRSDLNSHRMRLWSLIENTPWLDWLLLTKRPQHIKEYIPWQNLPSNIWLGTTVETQSWAEKRIPHLLGISASVHFLSCEPLLGYIDLSAWLKSGIDWVIAGGESGPKARPMNPDWVKDLRDQCLKANVPFHFKQWGHWAPEPSSVKRQVQTKTLHTVSRDIVTMWGLGKSEAGRYLDGKTWDGLPQL